MTTPQPDNTAVRSALWRALHVLADAPPYIIEDRIGYQLIKPERDWQERPDMKYTKRLRASVVARARFVEDTVIEQVENGTRQYVLLGAGLDSFAQRHPEYRSQLSIYEIDQPGTLAWKAEQLQQNGYAIPPNLHFIPVDFETSSWWEGLVNSGFDQTQRAVVSCTGVTLYLTRDAIQHTLNGLAALAPGSTIVMAFYLPLEDLDKEDQPMQERAIKGAAAAGTPFISFFSEDEIRELAEEAGLKQPRVAATEVLTKAYFTNRSDHLVPASGEVFLVAQT